MYLADELTYRILLGLLGGFYFLLRQFYIRKFRALDKTHTRNEQQATLGYKTLYAANFFMLVYVFTPWVDFAHLPLPGFLRWLGFAAIIAAFALYAWTHHTLGELWSGFLEISANHQLRTEGPYQYVRHPMYSAFFLYAIGVTLASANLLIGGVLLGATLLMYRMRVDAEEQMMLDQFGDDYRAYMNRSNRLWPRVPKPRSPTSGAP